MKQILLILLFTVPVCKASMATSTSTPATTSTATTLPTATPLAVAPDIHYSCFTNGNITINTTTLVNAQRNTDSNYSIAIGTEAHAEQFIFDNSSSPSCYSKRAPLSATPIQLTNCQYGQPVYVYLMQDKSNFVIGGKSFHEYSISCHLADKGTAQKASATFKIDSTDTNGTQAPSPQPFTKQPTFSLTMTINPAQAYVGEKMNLTIQDYGKAYYILPDNCTATSGTATSGTDSSKNQLLLESGKTHDSEILENFDVSKTGKAFATLYAIKFSDSDSVKLECDVRVCPTQNCGSTFTAYEAVGRKRRSADNHVMHVAAVKTTYRILHKDETDTENAPGHGDNVTANIQSTVSMCLLVLAFLKLQ